MPQFKLPLSGDVVQTINPWTSIFNPLGSQFGLVNISLGRSSNPEIEQQVLDDVGSYGRQLGRIGDVLVVLLDHFKPDRPLTADETKRIDGLRDMLAEIEAVKRKVQKDACAVEAASA